MDNQYNKETSGCCEGGTHQYSPTGEERKLHGVGYQQKNVCTKCGDEVYLMKDTCSQ